MNICIVAGHTSEGKGTGAVGYINESAENRVLGKKVTEYIKKAGHNCDYYEVNKSDTYLKDQVNFANKIIEKENNILKDLPENPSISEVEVSFNKSNIEDISNFDVIEISGFGDSDGYYRIRINEDKKYLIPLNSEEVPSIYPVYSNEETTDISYLNGNDVDNLATIYYPSSQGVLFEYERNGNIGENLYYYINSPMIDSGIKTTIEEHEVVGTRLKDSDDELKTVSVMNIFQGTDYSLSEDQSQWKYNKFGELIIDEKHINKTYPVL